MKIEKIKLKDIRERYAAVAITIADQSTVSAMNFITSILIGRFAGVSALGVYAICFSVLLMVSAASESVIISPYMIRFRQLTANRLSSYSGSIFLHQALIGVAASVFFVMVFWALSLSGNRGAFINELPILALILPTLLSRELARRYSMAHLHPSNALLVDALTAAAQLVILNLLVLTISLTTTAALLAIGTANLSGLLPWWFKERPMLRFVAGDVFADMKCNATLGAWNFAALSIFVAQLYIAPWLLALIADSSSVGIFAASNAIVMIANPLIQGISNHLIPRCAQLWSEVGLSGVKKIVAQYTLAIAVAVTAIGLPIVTFGGSLLTVFFGNGFSGNASIVSLLAMAMVVRALAMPTYIGLWSIGRSRTNAAINLFTVITLVLILIIMFDWIGLVGAAWAVLLTDTSSALARVLLFQLSPPNAKVQSTR